jgi:hypothetical protein
MPDGTCPSWRSLQRCKDEADAFFFLSFQWQRKLSFFLINVNIFYRTKGYHPIFLKKLRDIIFAMKIFNDHQPPLFVSGLMKNAEARFSVEISIKFG